MFRTRPNFANLILQTLSIQNYFLDNSKCQKTPMIILSVYGVEFKVQEVQKLNPKEPSFISNFSALSKKDLLF